MEVTAGSLVRSPALETPVGAARVGQRRVLPGRRDPVVTARRPTMAGSRLSPEAGSDLEAHGGTGIHAGRATVSSVSEEGHQQFVFREDGEAKGMCGRAQMSLPCYGTETHV